jgi:hypothetical protein
MAAPLQPSRSLATFYCYADVSADGSAALSKQITTGQFNPTIWEFAAQDRPDGWNARPTFSLSPPASEATARTPMVTK